MGGEREDGHASLRNAEGSKASEFREGCSPHSWKRRWDHLGRGLECQVKATAVSEKPSDQEECDVGCPPQWGVQVGPAQSTAEEKELRQKPANCRSPAS